MPISSSMLGRAKYAWLAGALGAVAGHPQVQAGPPSRATATPARHPVRASLLSEGDALVPGQTGYLAVVLDVAPGWYTYWTNAGDTGLPVRIAVDAPEHITVGTPLWPAPSWKLLDGGLLDYVYTGKVAVLLPVTPDASAPQGEAVEIQARAQWLVCRESCFPGDADLSIKLPIRPTSHPTQDAALFSSTRAQLPRAALESDRIDAKVRGRTLVIQVPRARQLTFFPDLTDDLDPVNLAVQGRARGAELRIDYSTFGSARSIEGVLNVERDGRVDHLRLSIPITGGSENGAE